MAKPPGMRAFVGALALAPTVLLVSIPTAAHAAAPAAPTAPMRAPVTAPVAPASGGISIQTTKTLSIVTQTQSTGYYCAPAAGRVLLSRFLSKSKLPSQKYIAGKMSTKTSGTTRSNNIKGLNNTGIRNKHEFINTHPSNAGNLWTFVINSTKKGWVMAGGVQYGHRPYGRTTSDKTGHIIVAYGYSTTGGKYIYWWDPIDNSRHKASLSKSWSSISRGGKFLIG
ncbi:MULTISPECIES: C39 family peptidase [Thermomonosporaceae]|uniref:C39 family peptidase n=1 Tax=Thermomonosporaceae TaxID=2012 RepID=UPI00255A8DC0|nr:MULTISPECIES: C39 family peptidase [Thermomonosporaceae]MDL4775832.1 C39 family peptidase [Actinomadura xylanilytica]